jgi:hypothetical protein
MKQTKPTNTLTKQNAELIYELLCNAGWMDDADELLAYIVEEEGKEEAVEQMNNVNSLITLINPLLDDPLNLIDEDLEDNEDESLKDYMESRFDR